MYASQDLSKSWRITSYLRIKLLAFTTELEVAYIYRENPSSENNLDTRSASHEQTELSLIPKRPSNHA